MLKYFGVLALFLISGGAGQDSNSPKKPPVFSTTYVTKAVIHVPHSEIEEPFSAWYDAEDSVSRVDYYGGMVKTYQLEKQGENGTMLRIEPITTENVTNKITCFQVKGPVKIQTVLPDLKNYKLIAEEIIRGVKAEKWEFIKDDGKKLKNYTMFIQYEKSAKDPSVQIPVPVKFIVKDGLAGQIFPFFDHYWIDYGYFSDEKPDSSVFQVNDMECEVLGGPGVDDVYTFNPIREFIEDYDDHVDMAFDKYKKTYNKDYNPEEHSRRREVFKHNARFIFSKNRASLGFNLGINILADKTPMELRALDRLRYSSVYNGSQPFPYDAEKEIKAAPDYFDWRLYGAVTPVKDQGTCGSCWSFSATGAIEGAYFVHTMPYGVLLRLSEQALIDCSWGFNNHGCKGGLPQKAYLWVMKHGGLPTHDSYGPYLAKEGYCHAQNVTLRAKISGYVNVTSGNKNALKVALLKHGPISVLIDASQPTFKFYSNGVYYEPKCNNTPTGLTHAVLVVGYGTLYNKQYWIVKNSWSNYWGNDGYILMAIKGNNCGVMNFPTYVTFP